MLPWDLGPALLNAVHSSQEESVKFLLKFDDYFDVHIQNALICAVRAYMKGCASSRMTRRLLDAGAKTKDGNVQKIVAKLRREETEEKHVKRLDAIHRLLRQEDAVHYRAPMKQCLPLYKAVPVSRQVIFFLVEALH